MNELAMQKLVVDAIKDDGGFAMKLSNRFMVGVVDLLVKPKNRTSSAVLEVKQRPLPSDPSREFVLEVTTPQKKFLGAAAEHTFNSGVVSFVYCKGKRNNRLGVFMSSYESIAGVGWKLCARQHIMLGPLAFEKRELLMHLDQLWEVNGWL